MQTRSSGIRLESDAIDSNGFIDPRYTYEFDNSSPELRWSDVPENCAGYAVLAEDSETTPPFTHWLVYNIPSQIRHLPAGLPAQETLPNGIRQGVNDFGKLGYGGPCPAIGDHAHRYTLRLYALREQPDLPPRATRQQISAAIAPYIIGSAALTYLYRRTIDRAG
jgi:Raf kinase inhibitor-like YbhB/YbcL family protein